MRNAAKPKCVDCQKPSMYKVETTVETVKNTEWLCKECYQKRKGKGTGGKIKKLFKFILKFYFYMLLVGLIVGLVTYVFGLE